MLGSDLAHGFDDAKRRPEVAGLNELQDQVRIAHQHLQPGVVERCRSPVDMAAHVGLQQHQMVGGDGDGPRDGRAARCGPSP